MIPNGPIYHGTLSQFANIDVNLGKGYKDFGRGFYCSESFQHSKALVNRNKGGACKNGVIYTYCFDINDYSNMRVKIFNSPTVEWFDFVLKNRASYNSAHNYDLVIGPTADDSTNIVLQAYNDGVYGEVGTAKAKKFAVDLLLTSKLATQYFFGTERAAYVLEKRGRRYLYV